MNPTSKTWPLYYRDNGVLTIDSMVDPLPVPVQKLPIGSVIHQLGDQDSKILDAKDPLYAGYSERILFHNVTQHDPNHDRGNAKTVVIVPQMAEFVKKNRNFKRMEGIESFSVLQPRQLAVVNYAWIEDAYRYPDTPVGNFMQTEDKFYALIKTIKDIDALTKRKHFIVMPTPMTLLPKTVLDLRSLDTEQKMSAIFSGLDERFLRHMWLFINPDTRSLSMFGELPEEMLQNVHVMYKSFGDNYLTLNIGYLFSWIRGNKNYTMKGNPILRDYPEVQKYYLRGMLGLQAYMINGASDATLAAEAAAKMKAQDEDAKAEANGEELSEDAQRRIEDESLEKAPELSFDDIGEMPVDTDIRGLRHLTIATGDAAAKDVVDRVKDADIDKDLEMLETMSHKRFSVIEKAEAEFKAKQIDQRALDKAKGAGGVPEIEPPEALSQVVDPDADLDMSATATSLYIPDIPDSIADIEAEFKRTDTINTALMKKLDKLAVSGAISAPEMRKRVQLINDIGQGEDPYGTGKIIKEAAAIADLDLKIDDFVADLDVPETVIDPSMARATLTAYGSKYNTDIIYKDTLACVQAIQRSGVIVKNHTVTQRSTELGDYDIHTIELQPLRGRPSVVTARVPRVNEDGVFTAKNSRYVMRKQPVDLPIRKIGTNRVGLSSYYGKTFVDRASKKANSYLAFVLSRLSKATIQPDDYLHDVAPSDVFDNYFEAPYIYSGISEHFRSFVAGDYILDFDSKGFRAKIDERINKKLEVAGARICGFTKEKHIVLVDKENVFWDVGDNGRTSIGDIFDLLRLERETAPVDFSEVKIYAKSVPVAMFLGYTIGLRKLIKLLGVKFRIVEGRKRKDMNPFEFSVQFRNVAYIFDRRDERNALVVAGFNAFEKEIKLYDAEYFDDKDIYLRILETKGMNAAYLSEIENLQDMFIDPITERVLKKMGEPTDFNELLLRATQMLMNYTHPASQDADYQRIRGNERFPGFLYKELTQAIRSFKSRNRTGRAKVDMSPYQVWTTITRDSSVKNAEDINPIQEMKISQEAITYVGEGGRGKESMNRESRAFLTSNIGVTAGESVDSSDVGVNTFAVADPKFDDLDGLSLNKKDVGAANMLSTAALLAPFSTNDDL